MAKRRTRILLLPVDYKTSYFYFYAADSRKSKPVLDGHCERDRKAQTVTDQHGKSLKQQLTETEGSTRQNVNTRPDVRFIDQKISKFDY